MKRTIINLLLVVITTVFLTSCGNEPSLQQYFVNHQESANFISQDVPLSMVEIDKSGFTETQMEAYESVKKLNFLGFKSSPSNIETYNTEIAKVKTILANEKYNDLMEFSDRGNKIIVKYLGEEDEADEVIVFGSAKETGFGVVRILGNDMSPEKMMTLIDAFQKANINEKQLENIVNFFK
ncbi:DUF4252 domain-containing protein [Neotamlana laminarinivorans]|uniref:DUF4252 domain-containing protein n=1 Tax=Neotamlana laminarinivorans TaxID=2883124 RepID=A0A9X1HZ31_9FLAO|nr:DUF4252 domain-containing protein [Tamlana laminarinivorans]MCB4798773.1 DUF4252 domain-containing protein [Tamlana laminarinivorans]